MLFEEKIHNREGEDVPESLWKFENIKRDEAEQILHAQSMPCFLIRASSVEGCSALSLRNEDGSLIHYIIGPSPNGLMIRNCPEDPFEYRSLSELVKKSVLLNKYVPAGRKAKLTFSKAKTMRVKDLNVILQDSHAYESFKTFLQLEYSSENLEVN